MNSYQYVQISVEGHVAIAALNRVDRLNAINPVLAKDIVDSITELSSSEEIRAIILASNARIFCAGIDLEAVARRDKSNISRRAFAKDPHYSLACCNILEQCKKPVIAAIHGKCIGGGLDIACACDIRLCSEDAEFSLREAAIGVVADMGVLQRIPHIIGQGFTREMAFTAKFYKAQEVEKFGLVNRVYPDKESLMVGAKELAAQIAANAPIAVEETKDVLNFSLTKVHEDGMAYAKQKNGILFSSEDMKEAAQAFREKRKPVFKGK